MISIYDATRLAQTKLQIKKGSLFISILIPSVLFSIVLALIMVGTGLSEAATSFTSYVYRQGYPLKISPVISDENLLTYKKISLTTADVQKIKQFEISYNNEQKKLYDKAGVQYAAPLPENGLLLPDITAPDTVPANERYFLNINSPIYGKFEQSELSNYLRSAPNKLSSLKSLAGRYNGSGFYKSYPIKIGQIPDQRLILDDKEDLRDPHASPAQDNTMYGLFTRAVRNSSYQVQNDPSFTKYITYTDPPSELQGIPVIISAQEAAILFGQKYSISSTPPADAAAKKQWLQSAQKALTGRTYQACYRNAAERSLVSKIQQDTLNNHLHDNDELYQAPTLQYQLPSSPCGDITIKSDNRTTAEKQRGLIEIANAKKLGVYTAPYHAKVTYQIVGLIDAEASKTNNFIDLAKGLLTDTVPISSAVIPEHLFSKIPETLKSAINTTGEVSDTNNALADENISDTTIFFHSIQDARAFLKNEACEMWVSPCSRLYKAAPVGSNYLIIEDVIRMFNTFIIWAPIVAMLLAAAVLAVTITRVIIDSRRETAIYRSMGARKHDIVLIYSIYAILISLRVIVVSLAISLIMAITVQISYGQYLQDILNFYANPQAGAGLRVNLIALSSPNLLYVILIIILSCISAAIIPIFRNVMRSPIEDMRSE